MQNKEVFQAGKTWSCKGISNLCMSQRLFRTLLSNTWRLSISYGNDNLVQRTKIMRFMIQLPHIPVDPFHLSCMQNGWQNSILLHTFLKNGYIIWNFLTNIRFFFFFCRLQFLDAIQDQWSFLLKLTYEMKTFEKGCNSLWIAELRISW